MHISWNEIRARAQKFSVEHKNDTIEKAQSQLFWNDFFTIFGIQFSHVAKFEHKIPNLKDSNSWIDVHCPRHKFMVEQKTRDKDLKEAFEQAMRYVPFLPVEERPNWVCACDFNRFEVHNLSTHECRQFLLKDLSKNIKAFAFLVDEEVEKPEDEEDADFKASKIMGDLHDALKESGYSGHDLERMLVRILFCLFAEDSRIFEENQFREFIRKHTKPDGSDTGTQLARLFEVLNTPQEKRQKNLDDVFAAFPYVNGGLFKETLHFADFNSKQREALFSTTNFNWSSISPAIFGSLFQGVMDAKERRQAGAHYTSEKDIMKVINSLFLDDLKAEFESVKTSKKDLTKFHEKLGSLKFFDPACGCGNFLILTYREMRRLEMAVLKQQFKGQRELEVKTLCQVDISAMHGIEIDEWATMIAETALWLMEHQMNLEMEKEFGNTRPTIPLGAGAKIVCGNSLRIPWEDVCKAKEGVFVLGNPPFVGKNLMNASQGEDMAAIWGTKNGVGVLDYVTGWYMKAANYIQGTRIAVGFVSTNSISQGEQVGVLWSALFKKGIKIHFAHRTFAWQSEARGRAHVHVVIIGFGQFDKGGKKVFDYLDLKGENVEVVEVGNISPYLVSGGDVVVEKRSRPISAFPEMIFGSMANDGGHLLLSNEEKNDLVKTEPASKNWIRPFRMGEEFINGISKWCLWLVDITPDELRQLPETLKRVQLVKETRQKSTRPTTQELAKSPTLFGEIRQPKSKYLALPKVSSERRAYIPMDFLSPKVIAGDKLFMIPAATLYHFAILTSQMHMAWTRQVCGRLKSDYSYSNTIVYNNFPWPLPSAAQTERLSNLAQAILDARAKFPDSTLADLYDPTSMPPELSKAHTELDRAVDAAYRKAPFANDRERVEFLFGEYEKLIAKEKAALVKAKKPSKKTPQPA